MLYANVARIDGCPLTWSTMSAPLSIKWDDDEPSESMNKIVIPISPTPAIPQAVGIILILGGLLAIFSGGANLIEVFSNEPLDSSAFEPLAQQIRSSGENITAEQIVEFYDNLESQGYYLVLGILETSAGICLLISGFLLFKLNKIGVRIGALGGILLLADALMGAYFISSSDPPSELLTLTLNILQGLVTMCGIFCTILPFVPLMFAGARQALEGKPIDILGAEAFEFENNESE
tara:strand:+ start:2772 stop:3476 length:705 start_codon:yes stop_codon:yes gene_type:complete